MIEGLDKLPDYPLWVRITATFVMLGLLAIGLVFIWFRPARGNSSASTGLSPNYSYPGLSLNAAIRFNNVLGAGRQFIFDYGKAAGERFSVYISADKIFTVSFVDAKGEPHLLQRPFGGEEIPLGEFLYFSCELGVGPRNTFVRMKVSRNEPIVITIPYRVDIGVLDIKNGVVGADLTGNNCSAFDLAELMVYSATLTNEQLAQMTDAFLIKKRTGVLEFRGKNWMRVGVDNNNLSQPDPDKQPIYRKL